MAYRQRDLAEPSAEKIAHTPDAEPCRTCASVSIGRYCPYCGEKRLALDQHSLAHFLREGAEAATSVDGKLWQSLRLLLTRPGFLAQEYFRGRRKPYLRPLQLFLICNFLYFLYASFFGANTFNNSLGSHISSANFFHVHHAKELVDRKLEETGIEWAIYERLFDSKSGTLSKTLIITMVPAMAVVLFLIAGRRAVFLKQLVFSTQLFSFALLLVPIVLTIFRMGAKLTLYFSPEFRLSSGVIEAILSGTMALVIGWYVYRGCREFFRNRRLIAAVKGVIALVALYYVLLGYRALLFYTTYFTLHIG